MELARHRSNLCKRTRIARGLGIVHSSNATLEWEDKLTEYFPVKRLPPHWNAEPPTFQTMQIGDEWVRAGKSVALAVPSVLSTSEMNFLLNPKHPDFKRIKISQPVEYRFDSRLLNR